MTVQATNSPTRTPFAAAGRALRRLGSFFVEHSGAMRCKREAERLFELSDEELARMGLTRDRIVQHAFARYLN